MGQSLSRRPPPDPTPTSASTPAPECTNDTRPPRRSLPRRIFSSLPKPSSRSRVLSSSLTLPTRPEQTLRDKKRRWGLSRRRNVATNIAGTVPEHMDHLAEHDEHQDDRDVDEFGVITHRVPDSHTGSQDESTKGKEKAKDTSDIPDDNGDDAALVSSSSAVSPPSQPGTHMDHTSDDQVVIAPTVPPSLPSPPSPPCQPPPLPTLQESDRPFVPPPSVSMPSPLSQSPVQPTNTSPRPFPPPGTLVVVQGVVHTTDVPRPSDRPTATFSPASQPTNDTLHLNTNSNFETSPTRNSSLPPGTGLRNPLSGILPRPTSLISTVPSSPPLDSVIGSSITDSQARQATSNATSSAEDSEDEDRTHVHAHGISMAQGPVGASGLSASSIDVLGTLLRYVPLNAWLSSRADADSLLKIVSQQRQQLHRF